MNETTTSASFNPPKNALRFNSHPPMRHTSAGRQVRVSRRFPTGIEDSKVNLWCQASWKQELSLGFRHAPNYGLAASRIPCPSRCVQRAGGARHACRGSGVTRRLRRAEALGPVTTPMGSRDGKRATGPHVLVPRLAHLKLPIMGRTLALAEPGQGCDSKAAQRRAGLREMTEPQGGGGETVPSPLD